MMFQFSTPRGKYSSSITYILALYLNCLLHKQQLVLSHIYIAQCQVFNACIHVGAAAAALSNKQSNAIVLSVCTLYQTLCTLE